MATKAANGNERRLTASLLKAMRIAMAASENKGVNR